MNDIEIKWRELAHDLRVKLGRSKLPDLNAVLFLIGINELGRVKKKFTKEEKQDLMHIAICRLFSESGYYEFEAIDQDGWPHWKQLRKMPALDVEEQEILLKQHIIHYFEQQ